MTVTVHSLLCFLALLAGSVAAAEPAVTVAPQQQWQVNLSEKDSAGPSAWRLFDERRWQEFWARNHRQDPPPPPDFSISSVLVVSGGERLTGGYRLEVVRAVKTPGNWVIEFVVHPPAPGSFVTQALTCPAAVTVFSGTGIIRPGVRDVTPPEPARRSP